MERDFKYDLLKTQNCIDCQLYLASTRLDLRCTNLEMSAIQVTFRIELYYYYVVTKHWETATPIEV